MKQQQHPRRGALRTCAVAAATGVLVALVAVPANAYTSVPIENGDAWNVHDSANPGVDTGSVMDTRHRALQGYGGIRVQVDGGAGPLQGVLLR
jgi:amidase